MPTVSIIGLPMTGKTKLIAALEDKLPDVKFVEDKAVAQSILAFHCGAHAESREAKKGHRKADLYVFLNVDPRVVAKRLRLYSDMNISGSGLMKALHKTRHDLKKMVDVERNNMIEISDKEFLTLGQIAELITVWLGRK